MVIEIENQINSIKEIVDNAMNVMIDEDEIFSFSKKNKENINNTQIIENIQIEKIIQSLLKLNILKTNNLMAKNELQASAKLSIHLIKEENDCEINKILSFLSN